MRSPSRTESSRLIPVFLAFLLGTSASPVFAASIRSVGTSAGAEACFPSGISPDGNAAVGTCRDLSLRPVPIAFLWTKDSGLVRLVDPLPNQARPASANAVSNGGSLIVGSTQDIGRGSEGYAWITGRGITGLGSPPGTSSVPTAIAPSTGLVVGTLDTAKGSKPFRWTSSSGMEPVSRLPIGLQAEAYAISADGSVLVGRAWQNGTQRTRGWAFRWTDRDGFVNLEAARDDDYYAGSTAVAVSADGQVVVGDNIFGGRRQAFRWTQERGMVALGCLSGEESSEPRAVSGDGRVILGQSGSRPFWWDDRGGLRDLQTVLENEQGMGTSLRGWQLQSVTGISADGRVLVGQGRNPAGEPDGWIVDLR